MMAGERRIKEEKEGEIRKQKEIENKRELTDKSKVTLGGAFDLY